jgi:trans-2,3-dihydro-3-hydroxyanthranilate isomerase
VTYRFHIADVFTDTPFGGNQLAVLPDAAGLDDTQMQTIAREFNFSETVFVFPPADPMNTRKLRIFTPGYELPFAGHPTVGTAYVLAHTGEIELAGDETRIVFEEGAGAVPVVIRSRDGVPVFSQLAAPRRPEVRRSELDAATIAGILSLDARDIDADGDYQVEAVSVGVPFLMVPIRSLDALGRARIDMEQWRATLEKSWAPEVYLFTRTADDEFRARMFAPTMGIVEDPATGSACASFGGYLASRSGIVDGTFRYLVRQGVEMGRPSLLEGEVDLTAGSVQGIRVGGASVLIASGEMHTQAPGVRRQAKSPRRQTSG